MKIIAKIFILLFITVQFASGSSAAPKDRIVRISADFSNGKVSNGTGFFWGENGDVLTAYHVVKSSTNIRIYYDGKVYDQIEVLSYSSDHDLALLRITGFHDDHERKTYPIRYNEDYSYDDNATLEVPGFPWGWNQIHKVRGYLTGDMLVSSLTFRDPSGNDLFKKKIDLLSIELKVYGGMSGAPVFSGDNVLGVLSGSLNEGGSIIWAIPVKYVKDKMVTIQKRPRDIDWEELSLMNNDLWRSLNFERKKPDSRWSRQVALMVNYEFDEYYVSLLGFRDDFTRSLSYGFEIGSYNYHYDQKYEIMEGFSEEEHKRTNYYFYFNAFLVRKHFGTAWRPYYGLSGGVPFNILARAGVNPFNRFNLETRLLYFRPEKKDVTFDYYGKSTQDTITDNEFLLFVGITVDM